MMIDAAEKKCMKRKKQCPSMSYFSSNLILSKTKIENIRENKGIAGLLPASVLFQFNLFLNPGLVT